MALTKNGLFSLINANLPDNNAGEISPADTREVATQNADSALNTIEASPQTVSGEVNFAGGIKKAGKSLISSAGETEILRAASVAASQQPTVVGTPLRIEFGTAQTLTKVSLAANGVLTCNVTGKYAVRFKLQKGRAGASGTSIVMSRILVNGVQVGISSASKITSPDAIFIVESRVAVPLNAGDQVELQIIRDSAGTNFGGLFSVTSSHGWNLAPTALLVVSEIVGE